MLAKIGVTISFVWEKDQVKWEKVAYLLKSTIWKSSFSKRFISGSSLIFQNEKSVDDWAVFNYGSLNFGKNKISE